MLIRRIVVISIVLIVFNFAQASALLNNNSVSSNTTSASISQTTNKTSTSNSTVSSAIQTNSTLSNTTEGVSLPATVLSNSTLYDAVLSNVTSSNSTLNSIIGLGEELSNATLSNATLSNTVLPNVTLSNITQNATQSSLQITSNSTNLSELSSTNVTSSPVSASTLNTWITSFSAKLVNSTVSSLIDNLNQLPQIIMAEKSDTDAINTAIDSQLSMLMNTSFVSLTDGQTIINALDMPIYTLANSTSDVAVIPTVVTTVNSTSEQFVATPPLAKIIPGQEMIIPVADSLIPSFGGLKEIDVQSSPTTTTDETAPEEWLVAEVDNKLPSSISASNIDGTIILFLNIQYPYEQTGVGFNWGDPTNHAKPPTLTLVINKTSSFLIQNDTSGCPIIDAYTLGSDSWTDNGLGETSSTSISPTQCQIKIQSQHLSMFALSMRHIGNNKETGPGEIGIGTAVSVLGNINSIPATSSTTDSTTTTTLSSDNASASYNVIADPATGFSNVECGKGTSYALMTGQYTGGSIPNKVIFLKLILLDSTGNVLATGNGHISDVGAHETKSFNAIVRYDKDFTSCQIQIDASIPK